MSVAIPLSMPEDLLEIVRETASVTGLSQQDVMRQSIKIGAPQLAERLKVERGLKPFTKEETKKAFGPDPEWDRLENALAKRSHNRPDFD